MATEALSYLGINRAYSDFAGSRACEELINLRPTSEGVVPVKDFSVKMANVEWSRIFVHHTTHGPKYLVIGKGTGSVYAKHIALEEGVWVVKKTFFTVTGLTGIEDAVVDAISYAAAGNIILFSLCDKTNSKYGNWAFTWKVTESGTAAYVDTEANVPPVEYSVGQTLASAEESIQTFQVGMAASEAQSSLESGLNAIQENNPKLCVGPFILAVAYRTKDGKTFWTGGWRVVDPVATVDAQSPLYVDASTSWYAEPYYTAAGWFTKYGHGYSVRPLTPSGTELKPISAITVYGTNVTLSFSRLANNTWDKDTSIIQSVEIYTSKPVPYIDVTKVADGMLDNVLLNDTTLILPFVGYDKLELGGQLLYHQASISMASLADDAQTVDLSFGGNIQLTEDTLDTDAGALVRYGRLLSYNARFHYWDSVSNIQVGMPYFHWADTGTASSAHVFVRYADNERTTLLYLGTISDYLGKADIVIAPSLNIKEVVTYTKNGGTFYVKMYRMTASSAYNYSICEDGPYSEPQGSGTVTEYEDLITAGAKTSLDTLEPAAINVTEQYNPFVFKVEHSYLAPGNIREVQPQMAGIVDSSYGRDPLNVFTERGLYALTQGSANVLYGAFLPLSDLVIGLGGGAVPTEMGTFFLADGALWLVSGRRCTLISDALHLGPHKYIRSCEGYQKISGVDESYDPGSAVTDPVYDISDYLSQPTFEEFVKGGARLSFNRFRMELFVSNPSYSYTYVLSLKYRQWFKISRRVWQDENGSDLANTPGTIAGRLNVIDLSTEVTGSVLVHLQSRPFSMGYQYIHLRRAVSMIRAKLSGTGGDRVVVGLYGSDDLQNWNLLAYAKRAGSTYTRTIGGHSVTTDFPLRVSQVRTPGAARSWRYYTVCVGGQVPSDTDLGPVVVEYDPVVRRIG